MTTEVRAPSTPIYLAGEFVETANALEVRNPADGSLVGTTFQAGADELERATVAAVEAFERTRRMASFERRDVLAHVAARIERDAEELSVLLSRESGKPIRDARGEVARGALTFASRPRSRRASTGSGCRSTGPPPTGGATGSCAATRSARSPASARSTSRSTWPPTRWRRPSPPAAASCSSPRRPTR